MLGPVQTVHARREGLGLCRTLRIGPGRYIPVLAVLVVAFTFREILIDEASSMVPHRFGCLCPVAHPQLLVDGAQVLLDRRLRQVQPCGYLGVAQALHSQFQDLSLTGRELPDLGGLVLAQEVPP